MDDLASNPELAKEYDRTFSSEEKVSNALKITKSNFTISIMPVDFDSLLIPDPIKKGRGDTYLGLTTSVAELGILSPIHVMVSEGYTLWQEENPTASETDYEGFKYILLDGFRRVWAGYKNGLTRCNAVVWDFEDKEQGSDLSTFISLILNKAQKRSWSETWYLYQILEMQTSMTPGTLEYLLGLESGEAMKLKDIMTCGYPEVIDDLKSNKKTIDQCFSALQKLRKEEDKLLKEDNQGIGEVDGASDLVDESANKDTILSNDEVNEILELDDDFELKDDDFDEMLQGKEPEVQKVGERHPLDPALKAESLLHDNYECVCCTEGRYLPMRYKLSVLQSHHKVAVAHGGEDSVENLATLCVGCHTLVHSLLWSGLKFGMSKEDFDALPENEQIKLKKIMQIAKFDYDAAKKQGKSTEDIMAENKHHSTFKMPGTDLRENAKAIKESGIGPEPTIGVS